MKSKVLLTSISEANLLKKQKVEDVQIPYHELITALTMDNPKLQYIRVLIGSMLNSAIQFDTLLEYRKTCIAKVRDKLFTA
jgi:hypothetical protein